MFSVWSWYTCYRGAARGCSRRGRRSWGGRGPAAPTPRSARGYWGPGGWKYPRHGTRWREEVQRSDIYYLQTMTCFHPPCALAGWGRTRSPGSCGRGGASRPAAPPPPAPPPGSRYCPPPPAPCRLLASGLQAGSVGTHQQFNIIFPCFPNYIYYLSAVSALFIIHNAVAEKCELTTPDWPLPPRPHNSALSLTIVTIVH